MICSFDTISIPMGLNREIIKGEATKYRSTANHLGTKYSEPLSFSVSFVKDDSTYSTQMDAAFTEEEINEIMAWLTSPQYPALFHMYSDDVNEKNFDYFGLFTGIESFTPAGEMIHGFTATFQTNAPYAWTPEIVKEYSCEDALNIQIECKTAEIESPIYPTIVVTPHNTGTAGNIDITISTDEGSLKFSAPKIPITIDCSKTKIFDSLGLISFEDLGIGDDGYVFWPRLWHGVNHINVHGSTDITITYREPRKVGAF